MRIVEDVADVPVALLGYGTVGSAVDRLIHESADGLERTTGVRFRVVRALVRDAGRARPGAPPLTADFGAVRDDPRVEVAVEAMGGLDPAGRHVRELLAAGVPVVTANKQLVAREGGELARVAAAGGADFRFEASVCAGLPVVATLRESLVAAPVTEIAGVVNGTANHVLTAMEHGTSLVEALADARRLGYAEPDATEDVNGADAAAKTAILATLAFGRHVHPDDVRTTGIERIRPEDARAARERGRALRLVARARAAGGTVDAAVAPELVPRDGPLAVDGVENAVVLRGPGIGELVLRGPGAGGAATATAIVADLVRVVRSRRSRGAAGERAQRLARPA